ncbi:MAG: HAD family hydrolase [Planctomycetota bacterium]|nr:HAD family hydrolase [Planctomycetota bacterium]
MAEGNELELNPQDGSQNHRVVVFDVDGTLTRTHELDEVWYRIAVREVLGVAEFSTDWSSYRHSTDLAIVREIIERHLGRLGTASEVDAVRDAYARRVVEGASHREIHPVPGADCLFAGLRARGWKIAIATGGWELTAKLKLDAAGIAVSGIPFASAEDADPREEIIGCALGRAGLNSITSPTEVVYVGDGRWDLTAANRGGYRFVGVGSGERARALRDAGARHVVSHFEDLDAFIEILQRASCQTAGSR